LFDYMFSFLYYPLTGEGMHKFETLDLEIVDGGSGSLTIRHKPSGAEVTLVSAQFGIDVSAYNEVNAKVSTEVRNDFSVLKVQGRYK